MYSISNDIRDELGNKIQDYTDLDLDSDIKDRAMESETQVILNLNEFDTHILWNIEEKINEINTLLKKNKE